MESAAASGTDLRPGEVWLPAVALAMAGLLLRLGVLDMPLFGAGAEVARAVRAIAAEGVVSFSATSGMTSVLPAWLLALTGLGASAALRVVEVLAAAALAPLVFVLLARAGLARQQALWIALVVLLQPALALWVGGPLAAGYGVASLLLVLGWTRALRPERTADGRGRSVWGQALLVAAMSLAAPLGLLHAAAWLVLGFTRRPRRESLGLLAIVVGAAFLPGAWPGPAFAAAGGDGTGTGRLAAVAWPAGLLVLLGVPTALGLLLRRHRGPVAVALSLALVAAHGVAAVRSPATDGSWLAWLILPLVGASVLGAWGISSWGSASSGRHALGRGRARWFGRALVACSAIATVALLLPVPLPFLAPGHETAMVEGRWRARATRLAGDAAGEGGLVAFDGQGSPAETASMADGLWGAVPAYSLASTASRPGLLPTLEAETLDPGLYVGLVAPRGVHGAVSTLGGSALFRFHVVAVLGPHAVLRGRRD